MGQQEELLPEAEAVKAFTEVSTQLVYEVNTGRNISLRLSVFCSFGKCVHSPSTSAVKMCSFLWKHLTAFIQ